MKKQLKFGDEVLPTDEYGDDKNRKFIFVGWCGNNLIGYGEIDTICENGDGFNENGKWTKNIGRVRECSTYVPKSQIKKKI